MSLIADTARRALDLLDDARDQTVVETVATLYDHGFFQHTSHRYRDILKVLTEPSSGIEMDEKTAGELLNDIGIA